MAELADNQDYVFDIETNREWGVRFALPDGGMTEWRFHLPKTSVLTAGMAGRIVGDFARSVFQCVTSDAPELSLTLLQGGSD